MKMTEEEVKSLVLALIASGRLPVSSCTRPDEAWAADVLNEVEAYVRLFLRAQKDREENR